ASAASTKLWPSRLGPRMATKPSPLPRFLESIERPVTGLDVSPRLEPLVALTISPIVQSGSAMSCLFLQCHNHRLMVGEGDDRGPDRLAGLVALPGDEQHVAFGKQGDRFGDGGCAVADLGGATRSCKNLTANLGGVLAARIVVGDDGEIGFLNRDASHFRPL